MIWCGISTDKGKSVPTNVSNAAPVKKPVRSTSPSAMNSIVSQKHLICDERNYGVVLFNLYSNEKTSEQLPRGPVFALVGFNPSYVLIFPARFLSAIDSIYHNPDKSGKSLRKIFLSGSSLCDDTAHVPPHCRSLQAASVSTDS